MLFKLLNLVKLFINFKIKKIQFVNIRDLDLNLNLKTGFNLENN